MRGTGSEGPALAQGGQQRGLAGTILSRVLPARNPESRARSPVGRW